jgi:hypothetical protein
LDFLVGKYVLAVDSKRKESKKWTKKAALWAAFVVVDGRVKPGHDESQAHEHPVVEPHVSHFKHVPLRTRVKFPHSPQASPS